MSVSLPPLGAPAVVLAGLALSVLVSACGGSPSPGAATIGATTASTTAASTSSAGSAHANAALVFARCMRSHGVPTFPDPGPQGDFPPFRTGVPKQTSIAANDACKHLLSSGGTATPQQLQQKLDLGVKVAQCLRKHGYPDFPDPKRLGSQSLPPGIDANSPQFQARETACEKQVRKALGLP